jgi:hypothetical protein
VVNLRHDTFIVLYSNLRAVPTQQIQHRPCRISHGDTTASFASARAPQILTKSPRCLLAPETLDYSTDACFPLQGTPGRCLARNFTCLFATQTPGAYRTLPWMDHSRPVSPLPTRISQMESRTTESGASHHMRRSVQTWPKWMPHLNLFMTLQPEVQILCLRGRHRETLFYGGATVLSTVEQCS